MFIHSFTSIGSGGGETVDPASRGKETFIPGSTLDELVGPIGYGGVVQAGTVVCYRLWP